MQDSVEWTDFTAPGRETFQWLRFQVVKIIKVIAVEGGQFTIMIIQTKMTMTCNTMVLCKITWRNLPYLEIIICI